MQYLELVHRRKELNRVLTPVNGEKSCTLFGTRSESIAYLRGISASKVSLRSLSGDYFKFLISMRSPYFLFFMTGFME